MPKHSVIREVKEISSQLAYPRNIGFFFGAGTSCALGIPNILQLTAIIEERLENTDKERFLKIKNDLASTHDSVNIEDILNQIRKIRELTKDRAGNSYLEISGEEAKSLDKKICELIYDIIEEKELAAVISPTQDFMVWLDSMNRDYSKEIFTTNYDLIIEKALEKCRIPYFDGFVGSYEPFFWQDSIDKFITGSDLTKSWVRLWKIHGSLNWFWKFDEANKQYSIVRVGKFDTSCIPDNELVIYPSKDKYDSSRKQPFVSYFDRLKNYLLRGELLFIFTGYSFSDQHINEIIFNCLRQNHRLSCIVFFYKDKEVEDLANVAKSIMNIQIFGPTKALINGVLSEWKFNKDELGENEKPEIYWNEKDNQLTLGDFNKLVNFLMTKFRDLNVLRKGAV